MTAGYNLTVAVHRISNEDPFGDSTDDVIGGHVPTGTCMGFARARLTPISQSMLLLQQGIETPQTWRFEMPLKLRVRENDQLEITKPKSHRFCGKRLLVVSVTDSSMHPRDSRSWQQGTVKRVERARGEQDT